MTKFSVTYAMAKIKIQKSITTKTKGAANQEKLGRLKHVVLISALLLLHLKKL